jgi:hypothetical protein
VPRGRVSHYRPSIDGRLVKHESLLFRDSGEEMGKKKKGALSGYCTRRPVFLSFANNLSSDTFFFNCLNTVAHSYGIICYPSKIP